MFGPTRSRSLDGAGGNTMFLRDSSSHIGDNGDQVSRTISTKIMVKGQCATDDFGREPKPSIGANA
jgi:hypothetical protein